MIIPEGWTRDSLGVVSLLLKDGTHGSHERVSDGIPICSAENITPAGKLEWNDEVSRVSREDYSQIHAKYSIKPNDLLLTIVGSIGRSALAPYISEQYTIQRSIAVIRPDTTRVSSKYLYQVSRGEAFQRELARRSNTTAQSGIYLGELSKISLLLPPLPEQKKIAAILSSVDETIEATQETIEQTKKVKQGLMQELLTKGIGHTRFKKTEIGEIPENWRMLRVKDVIHIMDSGWSPTCLAEQATEDNWGVLKTTCCVWEGFNQYENKALPSNLKPRPSLEVSTGDILVTRAGPLERVAVVVCVHTTRGKLMLSDKLIRVKANPEISHFPFLALSLSTRNAQKHLLGRKTGLAASQTNISQKILANTPIAVPQLSEQRRISAILSSIDKNVKSEKDVLQQLQLLKKGLMQDLLTGKVRVAV